MSRFLFIFLKQFFSSAFAVVCLFFVQHHWKIYLDLCQDSCLLFWQHHKTFIATHMNNIVYFFSLILQNILCESVYFFHIVKFSSQHIWIVLFIFFLSFFKIFYMNWFIFLILWNFHCNTCEQYCLLFFYHFSYCEIFITTHVNNIVYFFSIIFQIFLCKLVYLSNIVKFSL